MTANLRSSLRHRNGGGMAAYDRLPPDLRRWLAQAALPWSPRTALRIWQRHGHSCPSALAALDRAEAASLSKDELTSIKGNRTAQKPRRPVHIR